VLGQAFRGVLRAAAEGDGAAFAQLWRDNHAQLMRYLRVAAGDEAEDVASEVWLEIARRLSRFTGDEQEFRGWLFKTAHRRAIDSHRRGALRRESPAGVGAAGCLDRAAPDDTLSAALEDISTAAALALIATLPPDQAEIIVLRVVVGMDAKAVADVVGKSPGAVRVAAHRGLRALGTRIAGAPGAAGRGGVTR
jgi:RNA polymerase sigma-70 factor (ECF subfamily)